jgi:hypothetical protein
MAFADDTTVDNRSRVCKTATAQNTATNWLRLPRVGAGTGGGAVFDISVVLTAAVFSATVTLQRRRHGETDTEARDVKTYTDVVEELAQMAGDWEVRLIIKTGDYSSGTIRMELSA